MNKYLEKVAASNSDTNIGLMRYSHFAEHFNKNIDAINKSFKGDPKKDWEGYVNHIHSKMKSNKELYDSWKPKWEAAAQQLKQSGGKAWHANHKDDMDMQIDGLKDDYLSMKP